MITSLIALRSGVFRLRTDSPYFTALKSLIVADTRLGVCSLPSYGVFPFHMIPSDLISIVQCKGFLGRGPLLQCKAPGERGPRFNAPQQQKAQKTAEITARRSVQRSHSLLRVCGPQ